MSVLKNHHAPELSRANCRAKLSHSKQLLKNIHPVMLAQFCKVKKRYLQWSHCKHKELLTLCNCRNQEERRHDKTLVHTVNVQTCSHWWHQSANHKWSRKHKFDTCLSRSQGYWRLLSWRDAVIITLIHCIACDFSLITVHVSGCCSFLTLIFHKEV